jgi:hypothetical protein
MNMIWRKMTMSDGPQKYPAVHIIEQLPVWTAERVNA